MEAILKRTAQRVHDSEGEKLLIEQAQNGDREAFEELVRRHDRDILRLAFHMLGNREEAREVFQETFLKAYRSLHRFRFESSFYTWIYRIAINQARNRWRWWRRRRRDATVSLDSPDGLYGQPLHATLRAEQTSSPEQEALDHERERALRRALQNLGRAYRETVVLRDIEGFSYEEIAATLEISIGTVKSRLSRGREQLRRKLEGSL